MDDMTTEVAGHIPALTLGWRMQMALRHGGVSVGEMADYLEVDRNTVSRWTSDRIVPKRQSLVAWSVRTGVPIDWLMTGEDPGSGDSGPGGRGGDSGPDGGGADDETRTRNILLGRLQIDAEILPFPEAA